MILRLFFALGVVLLAGTSWFIVGSPPPTVQLMPVKAVTYDLQKSGFLPKGDIKANAEIEDAGIFEVPAMDAMMLDVAKKNMGDMPGMSMGGMKMDGKSGSMDMPKNADGSMKMDAASGTMDMAQSTDGGMKMDGKSGSMDMPKNADGSMKMDAASGTKDMAQSTDGGMKMDGKSAPEVVACESGGGLSFCPDGEGVDREITLSMREWGFDKMNIEVKKGERIRLTIRNDGQTLHEFMFMTMPLMQAVEYRAKRADWNLLEHKALFEQSLLLPGQEMTVVIDVQEAGSWMYMCMLPYHMQMGMMGQMSTAGAAMKM